MISPQIKFKKKWLDNKGVSEIIGTILMLAITVVLFSSIMVFVTNMPQPISRPNADFLSSLTYNTTTNSGIVTLTHNGGEALNDYETQLLVIVDGNIRLTPRTMAAGGLGATWGIGQKWTCWISSLAAANTLEIMVVDLHSNSQIWDGKISAGAGNNAPVILQRWTDSDPNTLTADTVIEGDSYFWLYVRVTDLDNDLNSVTVNAASIPGGISSETKDSLNQGVWGFNFTTPITKASLFDGNPLFIIAKDTANHWTNATFILTVSASERGPPGATGPKGNPGSGTPTNPSGLPSYLKYFDSDQGYVILGPNTTVNPPTLPNFNDARSLFKQGEWVFVRVASYKLQNIFAENSLILVNRLSGVTVHPCGGSNTTPFYRVAESSGVNVYEAKFDSSILLGGYDMMIDLQCTVTQGSSLISFGAITGLIVQPVSGTQLILPEIRTNRTMPLNTSNAEYMGSYSNPFDLSDASKCKIFVNLTLLNCGGGSTLNIGNVELKDLRNRQILYGVPPTSLGVNGTFGKKYSDLGGASHRSYGFAIDLRMKNGYNYVPGLSSYTLVVSNASDANEGIYSLSINIWIRSATSADNYIVSTSGFGFASGSVNFIHYDFLFQVENNRFFTTRVLDAVDMGPGSKGDYKFYQAIYFDIDGDGDRDAIVAEKYANAYVLGVYINRLNEFGLWEPRSVISSPDGVNVTALAYGDVDADGDNDWVVASSNQKITLYKNAFPVTTQLLTTLAAGEYVYKMSLADVTGDGKADLITLIGADYPRLVDSVGQIRMWDMYDGSLHAIADVDPAATVYDFDIADIDGDSDLDYAVVMSGANNVKWWESTKVSSIYYASGETKVTGTVNPDPGWSRTTAPPADGVAETLTEVGGNLEHKWTMNPIAGRKPILSVTAKVAPGATEGFFLSYSTDIAGPWTFMFAIPSTTTSYLTFAFPLPLSTSGTVYVRAIDTNPADGTNDGLMIDTISITTTDRVRFNAPATSEHILLSDATQRVIGIGDFDNYGKLDVAIAKRGQFKIVNSTSTIAIPILHNTTNIGIRPTVDTFSVADVNGDGLDDIVSVLLYSWTTVGPPVKTYSYDSIVYEWLNVGLNRVGSAVDFIGIEIKNMIVTYGNDTPGAIYSIAVQNPYG